MLSGKKIILGVTGSIAAYKAALLVRLLVKQGADVQVILTDGARRFVTDLTFSNLSQKPVFSDLWGGNWAEHVHLGTGADLMIIAPATANTLAKMAQGICDNALTAVYLSARCPVMAAPAMDADMYAHPATQENLARLRQQGVQLLPVGNGFLASGLEGPGRMAEPEEILAAVTAHFTPGPLTGRKVLISAGPTREPLDPVRYLSNHSTGKMGYALAAAAAARGAQVTLVSGPVHLSPPPGVHLIPVETAAGMATALLDAAPAHELIIMSAAVADYTPANPASEKIKKSGDSLDLHLIKTQDILKTLGERKTARQVLVGFALESENELAHAQGKLARKNLDFIVLNSIRDAGAGFGHDTNKIALLHKSGKIDEFPLKLKSELAGDILDIVVHALPDA